MFEFDVVEQKCDLKAREYRMRNFFDDVIKILEAKMKRVKSGSKSILVIYLVFYQKVLVKELVRTP